MQPGQILPCNIRDTNYVSYPLPGQTAQIETISAADFGFRIPPFSIYQNAPLYFQVGFDRSHVLLPRPGLSYGATWSLKQVDGNKVIVDHRPVAHTEKGVLCNKVDVIIDGTKEHVLTVHVPGAAYKRVLGIFKPYFNPSMRVTIARGGNPSRKPFDTLGKANPQET